MTKSLPVLDITPLLGYLPDPSNPGQYVLADETSPELQAAVTCVVAELFAACTNVGFFYIKTPFPGLPALIKRVETAAQAFFDQDIDIKKRIDMSTVGAAWRGFFAVGDEFTSGAPDIKQGIYFGSELGPEDPRVAAGLPMHGANVFPRSGDAIIAPDDAITASPTLPHPSFGFKETENDIELKVAVLTYLTQTRAIGFAIIDGLSLALELPRYALRNVLFTDMAAKQSLKSEAQQQEKTSASVAATVPSVLTQIDPSQLATKQPDEAYDPLCLFRIFSYPATKAYQAQYDQLGYITPTAPEPASTSPAQAQAPVPAPAAPTPPRTIYSVAEHTDYGCVTILYQDSSGGLEVRDIKSAEFIPAPPVPDTLVINIGDALEKMTNGLFVSTPHRVLSQRFHGDRISFPFFFDPSFDAQLASLVPLSPKLQEVFGTRAQESSSSVNESPSSSHDAVYTHNASYRRWDGKEIGLQGFSGSYGDYILNKVSKVFPQLARQVDLVEADPVGPVSTITKQE